MCVLLIDACTRVQEAFLRRVIGSAIAWARQPRGSELQRDACCGECEASEWAEWAQGESHHSEEVCAKPARATCTQPPRARSNNAERESDHRQTCRVEPQQLVCLFVNLDRSRREASACKRRFSYLTIASKRKMERCIAHHKLLATTGQKSRIMAYSYR